MNLIIRNKWANLLAFIGTLIIFFQTSEYQIIFFGISLLIYFLFKYLKNEKKIIEKIDKFLLFYQAKIIGPKFRCENLPNIDDFKEFDQKSVLTTINRKKHKFASGVIGWWPISMLYSISAALLLTSFYEGLKVLFLIPIFILIFGLPCYLIFCLIWLTFWTAETIKCKYKNCQARRGYRSLPMIKEISLGIVKTYQERKTNDRGVTTINNFVVKRIERTYQCMCCKRDIKHILNETYNA